MKKEYKQEYRLNDLRDMNHFLRGVTQYAYLFNLKERNPKLFNIVKLHWIVICLKNRGVDVMNEYNEEIKDIPCDFITDTKGYGLNVFDLSKYLDKPLTFYKKKTQTHPEMISWLHSGWIVKCLEKKLGFEFETKYKDILSC